MLVAARSLAQVARNPRRLSASNRISAYHVSGYYGLNALPVPCGRLQAEDIERRGGEDYPQPP